MRARRRISASARSPWDPCPPRCHALGRLWWSIREAVDAVDAEEEEEEEEAAAPPSWPSTSVILGAAYASNFLRRDATEAAAAPVGDAAGLLAEAPILGMRMDTRAFIVLLK